MENEAIANQIAYREELLKKQRLSSEERLWLMSHACYHQELGYPYLSQDVLEFPANTACVFSVASEGDENPSFISPCFLTVGDHKRNYLICESAVYDRKGNISIGEKIQSFRVHPASKQSRFIAFSEWGKIRVQYECTQIDNLGRSLQIACSQSSWLAMTKTVINDHCIVYACADPEDYRKRHAKICAEHRKMVPEDLTFHDFCFTVSWEKKEGAR